MDRDEGWNVPFAMGVVACPYLPLLQACHPLSAHNQSWVSQVLPWAWGPKLPGAIYYMGKKKEWPGRANERLPLLDFAPWCSLPHCHLYSRSVKCSSINKCFPRFPLLPRNTPIFLRKENKYFSRVLFALLKTQMEYPLYRWNGRISHHYAKIWILLGQSREGTSKINFLLD